jgi:hypothetical protein
MKRLIRGVSDGINNEQDRKKVKKVVAASRMLV